MNAFGENPGLYLSSVVSALGWTLLHFVWQGAVIAAAYALLSWLFDKSKATTRYSIGVGAMLLMLAAPVATFVMIYQAPILTSGVASNFVAGATVVGALNNTGPDFFLMLERLAETMIPWAVLAWFAGVALSGRRLYRDWRQVRGLITDQVRPLPEHWGRVARRLCDAYGIRVAVRILESGRVSVPMVLGWLKPVVLIPSSALLGLSHQQIEMLLAHEFAHVRRMDYFVNLVQVGVETLLFYHPAVRWVSSRVRHERELCCDELVVELTGDRLTYANALASMEELRSFSPSVSMAASGGQLLARIHRLAAGPAPQRGVIHWLVGIGLLASGVGMFATARMAIDVDAAEPVAPVEAVESAAEAPILDPVDVQEPLAVAPAPETSARLDPPRIDLPAASPESEFVAVENTQAEKTVEVAQPEVQTEYAVAPAPFETAAAVDATSQATGLSEPTDGAVSDVFEPIESEAVPVPELAAMLDTAPVDGFNEASILDSEVEPVPVITGGRLISGRQPEFPRKARLRGIEGWVTVRYNVGVDGRVHDLEIIESNPGRTFDRSVKRSLASWRFEPFVIDGQPVEQSMTRTIQFKMQPGSEKIADGCAFETGTRLCKETREPQMEESLNYQAQHKQQ